MIYLTTGANGAGKTLFTLRDVRKQQLEEGRPVYYHGFEAGEQLIEWGWKPFEPEKWQDLPDGSICIFDECQNEMPVKRTGAVPDWINAVAQFRRKRGFDFWLITPHPSFIDVNIRRLIESPSWHRHVKRQFGGELVSVIKYNSPNLQCEKPGAGSSGQVSMQPFPKEVFGWYKSASMHTAKKKIPRQVYVLGLCALLVPFLIYFAFGKLTSKATEKPAADAPASRTAAGQVAQGYGATPAAEMDYLESYQERIKGLPHTAPRYDEITKPQSAPMPAACVRMGDKCKCYTTQATLLQTPPDLCNSIVDNGWFDETLQPSRDRQKPMHGNPGGYTPYFPPNYAGAEADGRHLASMKVASPAPSVY